MSAPFYTGSSEFIVNTHTDESQRLPSITFLPIGGFVITWASWEQDGNRDGVYGQRYNADGTPSGTEFQINTFTDGDQDVPSVTSLSDGGFVVTWHSLQDGSNTGIYGQRYNADGTLNGGEFQINTFTDDAQRTPSVDSLPDGGFIVIWDSFGQDGDSWGIYGQRFNADGTPNGTEFRANTTTDGQQLWHDVAGLSGGDFVVAWSSPQDGDGNGVIGQRYNADGTPNGTEFLINTTTVGSQALPSMTALPDGGFVVTWGDDTGVYGQRFNADGTPNGTEFQIESDGGLTSVAPLSDGGFVVTWQIDELDGDSDGIFGQRYNADGTKDGIRFQINTFTDGSQTTPSVTTLPSGDFVVTWFGDRQDGSEEGIIARIFNASPTNTPPVVENALDDFSIDEMTALDYTIPADTFFDVNAQALTLSATLDDGSPLPSWLSFDPATGTFSGTPAHSDAGTIIVKVTADDGYGGVVNDNFDLMVNDYHYVGSDEFIVNSHTDNEQHSPSIAALTGGGFVVTWTSLGQDGSDEGIYGQRYNADGTPNGGEFQVNTTTDDEQTSSSVASLSGGGFIITWIGRHGDTDTADDEVLGQLYNADGTPNGTEFLIGDGGLESINSSSVAPLSDGGFVATWSRGYEDGDVDFSEHDVHGRRFHEDGTPNGDEFLINTYLPNKQDDSSVASLPDGSFVVAWTSGADLERDAPEFGQDGSSNGVYGQRYNANGTPNGGEFQVNTLTDGDQDSPSIAALSDGSFVVTWSSRGSDVTEPGIRGQLFSADGTPNGTEFQISTHLDGDQDGPSVTALSGGGFVVTWESWNQDGSEWGVYGQRFNVDGTPDGTEFIVNTTTDDDQRGSSVVALADDSFVVTWQSYDQDGSEWGVIAKIFTQTSGNTFIATEDEETFDGSGGVYTVDFSNGGGVDVDLENGEGEGGFADGDTLISIENLIGSPFDDELRGNDSHNILCGGDGDDVLKGQRGNDTLKGEGGDDVLWGNNGDDILIGGAGIDWMKGGDGADIFAFTVIDSNVDTIADMRSCDKIDLVELLKNSAGFVDEEAFSEGFVRLEQNGADTELYIDPDGATGSGAETILATLLGVNADALGLENFILPEEGMDDPDDPDDLPTEPVFLSGTDGNDRLVGSNFDDTLKGQEGNDTLFGHAGEDTLWGNNGDDTLYGGADSDWMKGGDGADLFVLDGADPGFDEIFDLRLGSGDRIQIKDILSFDPLADDIADFVEITQSVDDSIIAVDLDGTTGGQNFIAIAQTTNITGLDVAQMFADGDLIISDVLV